MSAAPRLVERPQWRDRHGLFADREDAALAVAALMEAEWKGRTKAMVLAVPSGGVPVGLVLARELGLGFELVLARKLRIPGTTEAGFGALAVNGTLLLNEQLMVDLGIGQEEVRAEEAEVRAELARRNERFRAGRPFPDLAGRDVVLADDGLASGYTMRACLAAVAEAGAAETAVAVPTAPLPSIALLAGEADAVFCPNVCRGGRFAVAEAYRRWRDLDPDEVEALLRNAGFLPQRPGSSQ